ncbi:unnamed protein product [Sphagnum jensenii]|uniref:Myotubularin phosphatase domain-containing protein n=1 Tax=Sphagnum jensenii TaxID=128206 RepID=A0ABP0VG95_9BRYO
MVTNGRKLQLIYKQINLRNRKNIDIVDVETAIASQVATCPQLRSASAAQMISECDVDKKGKTEVSFADIFALMSTSTPMCVSSLKTFLLEWMRLSTQRIEIHYSGGEASAAGLSEELYDLKIDRLRQYDETSVDAPNGGAAVSNPNAQRAIDRIDLLEGEKVLSATNKVVFTIAAPVPGEGIGGSVGRGDASLTNFRIILMDNSGAGAADTTEFRYDAPLYPSQVSVPFASIARAELEQDTGYDILIVSKDLRVVRLGFSDGKKFASQFIGVLQSYAFPSDVRHLFAFARYSRTAPPSDNKRSKDASSKADATASSRSSIVKAPSTSTQAIDGWLVFTPAKEFHRQGLLGATSNWRLWQDGYQLSPTYPSAFVLPAALSDSEVMDAAKFRSKQRMPALTWRSPLSGAYHHSCWLLS